MASKKEKDNNFIYLVLSIFIIVVFIIIAEVLLVSKVLKKSSEEYNSLFSSNTNDKFYDVSKENPIESNLEGKLYINTICENECSVKVQNYYFIFKLEGNMFKLFITDGNRLITTKEMGSSINDVYLTYYDKDILVYNKYINDSFVYDYAVLLSPNDLVDEFVSLEQNEMEFNVDGIVYYYDECNKGKTPNAYKVKALRKPFDKVAKELSKIEKNYSWCSN